MRKHRLHFWVLTVISAVFFVSLILAVYKDAELGLSFEPSMLAIIPAMSLVANIYLLATVIRKKKYIKSILWFGIFITSAIFWAAVDMLTYLGANEKTSLFVRSFVVIPALLGSCAMLIFTTDATNEDTEKLIGARILMFVTSFAYLIVALTTNLIFIRDPAQMISRFWGWETALGPYSMLYLVWGNIVILLIAANAVGYYKSRKQLAQKRQAKIFLASVLIPVFGIIVTNLIPGYFGLPWIPLDSLFITIMAGLMLYGINKYQLFIIDPAKISNNILETMTESVVVTSLDFQLQYLNKNAMALLGASDPSNSAEQSLKDLMEIDDFTQIREFARQNKSIKVSKKFSGLKIVPKGSSESVPVEISLSNVNFEGKKSVGYVFVMSDISELQIAYAKLAEQEQKVEKQVQERTKQLYAEHAKLEASISGLPIGFIMLDESMKVIEQNAVAQKLFNTRENNWWYVQDALEEMGVDKSVLRKVSRDEIIDIPEVIRGDKFLHIIISPIVSEKKVLGRVILIEDITDQKAAERERNEFVVTASHEIRTPLSVIQGNLSNALDLSSKIDPVLKPLIKSAYKASNQISSLFKDILIVADIENEGDPKQKFETTFVLKDAITEVIEHLEPSAKEKKLSLSLKISGSNIKVSGDRDEIKECILKLIDNGIKFTKKGSVKVEVSKSSSSVNIKVIDSGQGISSVEEKRLFRKFIRLDNSLKREVGGAGLGLYIAKALAQRNNGELTLEESSKKGSVFRLTLPASK
jgi:two-component system, OmpR family, phosphate regulon sensor histidine kinase PhoR